MGLGVKLAGREGRVKEGRKVGGGAPMRGRV